MPNILIQAGRVVALTVVAYLAAGCAASVQDENARKTALVSTEAPSQERLAKVQLSVARDAYEQGSLNTALELFEKAQKSAPNAAAPLIGKGDTLFALRRFNAAEAAYRAAVLRDPGSFAANEGLGKTLVTLQKFHAGLRAFEAARAIREDASLLNKIGVTHELMGDGAAAQRMFRKALALDEHSLTARNNLALSLAVSGSYDAALSEMKQVVADPRASQRHNANLAFIYGLAGRPMSEAPPKAVQAAAEKGWDEQFFARTRKFAEAGNRAAILDLLSNRAAPAAASPEARNLPEMPEMPEMPAMPEANADNAAPPAAAGKAASPVNLASAPAAPAPQTAGEAAQVPEAAPDSAPISTDSAPAEPRTAAIVTPPAPAPAETPAETAAIVVPQPPPAPAETAQPSASQPEERQAISAPQPAPAETAQPPVSMPEERQAMRAAQPAPAETAAPARTVLPKTFTHYVQLGAYHTRWLGRALRQIAARAGDVLPGGRMEVVRGTRFHTVRSGPVAELADARKICTTLRSRNVDCFVTRQSSPPSGQEFDVATAGDAKALKQFLANVEPIGPQRAPATSAPEKEKAVAALDSGPMAAPQAAPKAAAAPAVASTAVPPAAEPADKGEFRIQFAAYRRPADLGRGIKVLSRMAGDLLPPIEKLVHAESAHGTKIPYRLRSAPLESQAAAADLCRSLSEKGVECLVIRHGTKTWLPYS